MSATSDEVANELMRLLPYIDSSEMRAEAAAMFTRLGSHTAGLTEERDALRAERDLHVRVHHKDVAQVARLEEALREIARLEGMASASDIARNALSQDTESPRPANCDCGCSPPGPGLHYANCPAATADDTESPEEPA